MKKLILIGIIITTFISCENIEIDTAELGSLNGATATDTRCLDAPSGSFHFGSGTASDEFLICSTSEWNSIDAYCTANSNCDDVYFKVGAAIEFSSLNTDSDLSALTSSDNNITPIDFFAGNIDGGSHIISGIIYVGDGSSPSGLIQRYIGTSGTFKNIKIHNSYFNSPNLTPIDFTDDGVGSIIGLSDQNTVESLLFENIEILGGVLVSDQNGTGGIIGLDQAANLTSFKDIKTEVNIVSTSDFAGSLTGYSIELDIDNVDASGKIEADRFAAGIVGFIYQSSVIKNISCVIDITGGSNNGGLIGQLNNTSVIENIYYKGSINNATYGTAGLIGASFGGNVDISNIKIETDINANISSTNIGGVIGIGTSAFTFDSIEVNADIQGGTYVGGFMGASYHQSMTVSNLNINSNITFGENNIGGVFGQVTGDFSIGDLALETSLTQSSSSASSLEYIGGVIGANYSTTSFIDAATIDTSINFLASSTVSFVGSYMGANSSDTTMSDTDFVGSIASSGAIDCSGPISALIGSDNFNSGATQFGSSFTLNLNDLSCL